MYGDYNVVAMAGQGLIDGVVNYLENHVMQSCAIGGVADVHSWSFPDSFQAFQDLDAGRVITAIVVLAAVIALAVFGH